MKLIFWFRLVAGMAAVVLSGGFAGGLKAADPSDRPNVLFVAVDDLNDWIGVLGGHPQSRTPNIDKLTKRGVLFTRAYCAAPACNPSRVALMTGIRPSTSGVYVNPQPWRPAMPDAVTLSQHFMKHGYNAYGAGKIFHGRYKDPQSWNEYFDRPGDPKPSAKVREDPHSRAGGIVFGKLDAEDGEMGDHQVVSWVIEKLEQKHEKPFFLACGIFRPHMPWQVPQKYYDQYPLDSIQLPEVPEDDLLDLPSAGRRMARPEGDHATILKTGNWKHAVQAYLASIAFTDAQIGRLLEAFDRSHHRDNTVVVFWTDHGWHLGEKKHWRKFALWEEATRTPMAMVVPGLTKRGQRCDRTVNLLDIYPTLADVCGLPARPELEGVSLKPLLKDPAAKWERPSLTTHGRMNHALRSEEFRYIRYADGSEELYDHRQDPMEWKNLADDPAHGSVKDKLAKWLPEKNVAEAPRDKSSRRGRKKKK